MEVAVMTYAQPIKALMYSDYSDLGQQVNVEH